MTKLNHIKTAKSVTIILENGDPISIPAEDPRFKKVVELLKKKDLEKVEETIDIAGQINKKAKGFTVRDRRAFIDGEPLPSSLSRTLVELVEKKVDTNHLVKFWKNLRKNPSEDSREDLHAFLEANKVPITKDGCFVGYKKVRGDYTDSYSGEFDNSPGTVVKMDRSKVNADRYQTCSAGLHVAAFSYAKNFNGAILIKVKVNPKNVVAVPVDYDRQKIRVCEYKVLGDHKGGEVKAPYIGREKAEDSIFDLKLNSKGTIYLIKKLTDELGVKDGETFKFGTVRTKDRIVVSQFTENMPKRLTNRGEFNITKKGAFIPRRAFEGTALERSQTFVARVKDNAIHIKVQ